MKVHDCNKKIYKLLEQLEELDDEYNSGFFEGMILATDSHYGDGDQQSLVQIVKTLSTFKDVTVIEMSAETSHFLAGTPKQIQKRLERLIKES